MASLLARDALRQALHDAPENAEERSGLVANAARFLAGYGVYLNVGTDRTVGRVLDALSASSVGHLLVGAYDEHVHRKARMYCRVGRVANQIRQTLHKWGAEGVPTSEWALEARWAAELPLVFPHTPRQCKEAVEQALRESSSDWSTESRVFRPGGGVARIGENWLNSA